MSDTETNLEYLREAEYCAAGSGRERAAAAAHSAIDCGNAALDQLAAIRAHIEAPEGDLIEALDAWVAAAVEVATAAKEDELCSIREAGIAFSRTVDDLKKAEKEADFLRGRLRVECERLAARPTMADLERVATDRDEARRAANIAEEGLKAAVRDHGALQASIEDAAVHFGERGPCIRITPTLAKLVESLTPDLHPTGHTLALVAVLRYLIDEAEAGK